MERCIAHNGTFYDGELVTATTVIGEYDGEAWYARANAWSKNYVTGTGFPLRKLVDEPDEQPLSSESDSDYIVFRYGEVLLNMAEAALELGEQDEALEYVNKIKGTCRHDITRVGKS